MSERRKVLRAAGVVGSLTLLSRITGLLRGAVLTAMFGDSRLHDVFLTAFEIANLPRRVLGEGALSSFVVPLMTERREQGGPAAGWQFLNRAANLMGALALVLTLGCMLFAREVFLVAGGLGLRARGELAMLPAGTHLVVIMSPFILGLTIASVLMGACHTLGSFGPPTLGSVMLNLAMIATGLAAMAWRIPPETGARWLAWSVLAGVALRTALMLPPLWRAGWRWRPQWSLRDPHVRRLLRVMLPGLAAMSIAHLNLFVSNFFAMYLAPGVKTYIIYAGLLIQFPMALTATAAATALLPQLTQLQLQNRMGELRDVLGMTKRLEIVLMTPAMAGLIAFGLPIVQLVFERGRWSGAASYGTYLALLCYAPALLPLGWNRLLEPVFYARHDRVTPLKAAAASFALNMALNWFFAFHTTLNQMGLAIAYTVASFLNYALLSRWLARRIPDAFGPGAHIGETLVKALLAAAVACAAGRLGYDALAHLTGPPAHSGALALRLLPTIAVVAALYFWLIHRLRVPEPDRAIDAFRRAIARRLGRAR